MRSNDDAVESQDFFFRRTKSLISYASAHLVFAAWVGQSLRVKIRDFETLGTLCAASACRMGSMNS